VLPQFQLTFDAPFGLVRIDGDLDLTTDCYVSSVFETLEGCGVRQIEADLAGVTFIDAYALGQLRRVQRHVTVIGGQLHVVAGSDRYVRTCRLAQYDTLLPEGLHAAERR
jgi:anti-anti-sigma factor